MLDRIIGVLKLNSATFEEIEHDQNATSQAAIVVVIVALVSGLGSGLISGGSFIGGFLTTAIGTLIGWVLWSAITYFVGTKLFEGQADLGEMLRVIGFSYAPQVLSFIPCVGLLTLLWTLAAGFVAVRQGLDLDNLKAFLTIVVGFIIFLAVFFVLGLVFGVTAFGVNAITGG